MLRIHRRRANSHFLILHWEVLRDAKAPRWPRRGVFASGAGYALAVGRRDHPPDRLQLGLRAGSGSRAGRRPAAEVRDRAPAVEAAQESAAAKSPRPAAVSARGSAPWWAPSTRARSMCARRPPRAGPRAAFGQSITTGPCAVEHHVVRVEVEVQQRVAVADRRREPAGRRDRVEPVVQPRERRPRGGRSARAGAPRSSSIVGPSRRSITMSVSLSAPARPAPGSRARARAPSRRPRARCRAACGNGAGPCRRRARTRRRCGPSRSAPSRLHRIAPRGRSRLAPTPEYVENANVTRFMRAHGIDSIDEFRRRSVEDIGVVLGRGRQGPRDRVHDSLRARARQLRRARLDEVVHRRPRQPHPQLRRPPCRSEAAATGSR